MSNKIIIAKSGFNALTETHPDNLRFSSDYNTLKYYLSGSINVAWSEGTTLWESTVTHNLGYIPFFIAFVIVGGGSLYNVVPRNNNVVAGEDYTNAYADATKIYFQTRVNQGGSRSGTVTFFYKIFKNNIGL